MCLQLKFWDLATVHFFELLRRPNGKSDRIKPFNTFESLMKVFGNLFGIRFEIVYIVANFVTCWNEGTFVRTAPVQEVGVLLKWNNLKSFDKWITYVCNLLLLTTKFYLQNQSPKCRVDGYKFRSVYIVFTVSFMQTFFQSI